MIGVDFDKSYLSEGSKNLESSKLVERDSITSEVFPRSAKRGRPPKSRVSASNAQTVDSKTPDETVRTGAQAPIGFVDEFLSSSPPSSSLSNQTNKIESRVDQAKTPKSSLKTVQRDTDKKSYRLSSTFRQVSFSGNEKTTTNTSPTKPKSKVETTHEYDDDVHDDDFGDSRDFNLNETYSSSKSSARKSMASVTPATSVGISTPGSYDFPRGTLLDPNDENDVYEDGIFVLMMILTY